MNKVGATTTGIGHYERNDDHLIFTKERYLSRLDEPSDLRSFWDETLGKARTCGTC